MPNAITWHGTLQGVELVGGRYLALPDVAVGSVPGVGLVTARNRDELMAGRLLPLSAGRYQRVSKVFYRRRREGDYAGLNWVHEVKATAVSVGPRGPVFVSLSPRRAARVCVSPPGDFMCEG